MNEPMKPGRELDKLVAEIMGCRVVAVEGDYVLATQPGKPYDELPEYSTDDLAALIMQEWLGGNHPWGDNIALGLSWSLQEGKPAVILKEIVHWGAMWTKREITGETYPHAIALAVVATRAANAQ